MLEDNSELAACPFRIVDDQVEDQNEVGVLMMDLGGRAFPIPFAVTIITNAFPLQIETLTMLWKMCLFFVTQSLCTSWNFCKFLIDRNGRPYKRFGAPQTPNSCIADIEKLLEETADKSAL